LGKDLIALEWHDRNILMHVVRKTCC